jgi:uncharacterized protein YkwD
MKYVAILLFAICGSIHGATYEEGKYADGFEHEGPAEPEVHEVVHVPKIPDANSTLHKGLIHKGSNAQLRAAGPTLATSDANVQKDIVNIHNTLRRIVPTTSTFEMSWDNDIQKIAQQWAERCEFRHPTSQSEKDQYLKTSKYGCGQNIAMGTGSMTWNQTISGMWYGEVKDFKFGQDTGKVVGHYTAIVWKNTNKVGCGYKLCKPGPDQFNFFVCNYGPAGNVYPDQFKPYEAGTKCGKCPKNCNNGLCTNPCPVTNGLSNCEVQQGTYGPLFPNGCDNAPSYLANFKAQCQATCQCKGKLLY